MRNKFSFLCVICKFDVPKCKLILKNSSLQYWLYFRLFCGGQKITSGYIFIDPLKNIENVFVK